MHGHLEFWLFPPQGTAESAVRARACMFKDVTEDAICVGHLDLDEVPEYGEVERIARLGMDMAQGTGKYAGSGGSWRDPGLCLVAIAAESGDFPSRTLLAYEIAREVGHAMAEDDHCRIPAVWIRTLSRRVVDLLSERPSLLPNHRPEPVPWKDDRIEDLWLSTRKADAHLLAETLLPHIGETVSKAHPRLDRDVRTALERVVRSRCMQSGPLHHAASLLAAGKADGHLADPQKLARVLHWGAACLGERGSMLAVAEYLLMEIERPDRTTETEALYSLVHGWLHFGISHCRLGGIGPIRQVMRDMASVKVGLQRGPLAPEADSGVRDASPGTLAGFNTAKEPAAEEDEFPFAGDDEEEAKPAPAETAGRRACRVVLGDLEGTLKYIREQYAPLMQPVELKACPVDPEVIRQALSMDFPWMAPAIGMVVDDLWTRRSLGDPTARFRPILLWGRAGIGKTTFAKRLSELLGLPMLMIAAAGASTNLTLKGLSKGYQGAHPSATLEFILRHRVANPVAVVDEVDKVSIGSHNGDLTQTLLDFLEPVTARGWHDDCLNTEVDVSHISWILTANDVGRVPGPLLSRCRTFEIPAPDRSHFDALLRSIRRRLAEEAGCRPEMLPVFDDVEEEALRRSFARHTTVRSLKSKVERLVGLRARSAPAGIALN